MSRRWLALLLVLAACVAPVRTPKVYEAKAAKTAEEARSAVESARLFVETGARGRAFAPYLSIAIAEAEKDASGAAGAFDSMQPPDHESDQIREELDALLTEATSVISELRIAVRRGQLADLVSIARPLAELSKKLDRFLEEHS
jgi:hypothetical protein